jgi:diacylglycerol O-acyltransferase
MKKIPLIDDAFLRLESRNQPLHIGVLMLFEPPGNAPEDFATKLVQKLRRADTATGLFNQRLVETRGQHYWEKNEDFDLAHHFVHLALPRPGRIRELLDMVSRLHCGHLDRSYPLWRMYLIEGLEDGRIALYMKVHHSMVDGVGGMQLLLRSMSTSRAQSKKLPPVWKMERRGKAPKSTPVVPAPGLGNLIKVRSLARDGWRSASPVIKKLRKTFRDYQQHNPDVAMAGEAPKCSFNQPISGTRRFSAQSYATSRIKAIARAVDATSNDVILAMVAGALRKYLEQHDKLPRKPLNAGVPVSIRTNNSKDEAANQVAFTIANLATDINDPVERLRAIKRSMDYNKEQLYGLSSTQIQAYASLSMIPGALNTLLGRKPENTLGNVVVSNVPGPRKTLYWQGAKVSGIYPISLLISTAGLNITVITRRDEVDFGIIACRKTVPQAQRLLDYLEDALADLETGVGIKRARPKAARKKTAAKNKSAKGKARKAPAKRKAATKPAAKTKTAPRKRSTAS